MEGASEVMAAGLKRAAEVKTLSVCIGAGQREACFPLVSSQNGRGRRR